MSRLPEILDAMIQCFGRSFLWTDMPLPTARSPGVVKIAGA